MSSLQVAQAFSALRKLVTKKYHVPHISYITTYIAEIPACHWPQAPNSQ